MDPKSIRELTTAADHPAPDRWLAIFAKLVVAMTFLLIFAGAATTTAGAGMAFPDWPLSHGSLNPDGWFRVPDQLREHGHRIMAETVGLLVGILCAWIWRAKWALPIAIGASVLAALGAHFAGQPPPAVAHAGLWTAAVVFAVLILVRAGRDDHRHPPLVRWLAFGAFCAVLAQAVLGGLRVTTETGGDPDSAMIFRVVHGCVAQADLCLLVCIAALLSPAWRRIGPNRRLRAVCWLGWISAGIVFLQLIGGAVMRHLGAGLAIPTFPAANSDGAFMPAVHNLPTDLNFIHTRFGAAIVTAALIVLATVALRRSRGDARIVRPSVLVLALVAAQVTMGMFVIWKMRPQLLTSLHVVNGAALLATTVLLAIRAGHARGLARESTEAPL